MDSHWIRDGVVHHLPCVSLPLWIPGDEYQKGEEQGAAEEAIAAIDVSF